MFCLDKLVFTEQFCFSKQSCFYLNKLVVFVNKLNLFSAPILKIKQALANIEKECFVMSVQIAVLEQTLIQTRLSKQYDEHLGNNVLDYL